MKPEIAAILREPFAPENVGKLPRVYCGACRNAPGKVCQNHTKVRCRDCGNNITSAHLHLDYVGHAEITDRLLKADPDWTWEPVAFGADGLPLRDPMGGLWIRLTVAGVTRLGYGHADGKTGPDAVKEAIGDALRNGAMRFGVALDLWGATFKEGADDHEHQEQPQPARPVSGPPAAQPRPVPKAAEVRDWTLHADRTADGIRNAATKLLREHPAVAAERVTNEHGDDEQLSVLMERRAKEMEPQPQAAEPVQVDDRRRKRMFALLTELGYGDREKYHEVIAKVTKREVATSKDLTPAEVEDVIAALEARKRKLAQGRRAA